MIMRDDTTVFFRRANGAWYYKDFGWSTLYSEEERFVSSLFDQQVEFTISFFNFGGPHPAMMLYCGINYFSIVKSARNY